MKLTNLPPPNAKVKNAQSYTSTPTYVFMVWCLIKLMIRFHGVVLDLGIMITLPLLYLLI